MRIAISPRFATRTFEKGTDRILSQQVTLPDQLTIARALSVPVVVALYEWNFSGHDYWATGVFIAAMTTDWFDGMIARRQGHTSSLGTLLDPVADKLLVLSVLVVLIDQGVFPAWMVVGIVAREFLVSGLRLAALERGVVIAARRRVGPPAPTRASGSRTPAVQRSPPRAPRESPAAPRRSAPA